MKIKDILKSLAPKWLVLLRVKLIVLVKTIVLFIEDAKYFITNSGVLNKQKKSRLAKIIKNYHKVEKGLTLSPRRYHFGEAVIQSLLNDIQNAVQDSSVKSEEISECENALNALMTYIQCHENKVTEFIDKLNTSAQTLIQEIENKHNGTEVELTDAIHLHSNVDSSFSEADIDLFERVINSRKSVRRFSSVKVNKETLELAINLALQSPSACNRQPWFVTHLNRKVDVTKALEIQKGNISLAENVNELLVIWMDVSRALSPEERGQHFFDGGLFSMNLANALQVRGVSSCFLNWAKSRKDDDALRKHFNISANYKPVTFLAIGYADQNSMVCRSARKSLKNSYVSI